MARQINRLNARSVQTTTKVGRHGDGGGLYLVVDAGGAKRWVFLYRSRSTQKLREMGLAGSPPSRSAHAREKAAIARAQLAVGRDPLEDKGRNQGPRPTFGTVSDQFIEAMETSWKNEKHAAQWRSTLQTYCPAIRDMPIDMVTLPNGISTSRVVFDPIRIHVSADELLQQPSPRAEDAKSALDEACDFLRHELADGPKSAKDIADAAKDADIAKGTLARARKSLRIKPEKVGSGPWMLALATSRQGMQGAQGTHGTQHFGRR